jgi:hypothetical protein
LAHRYVPTAVRGCSINSSVACACASSVPP